MTTTINSRSGEKGFTLVELSIVMIIIGLLIGGILKGQELIANARLAAGVAKVKAIDAAINTFRDSYQALPGDVVTPTTRLPNCLVTTMCGQAAGAGTRGDNHIGNGTSTAGATQGNTSENIQAWAQLSAADLMGGVTNGAAAGNVEGGSTVPNAEVPGQVYIGYESGAAKPTAYAGPIEASRAGHYLLIHSGANGGAASVVASGGASGTAGLTPTQASRFDAKLDDGAPNSGSVLAMGTAAGGPAGCSTTAAADSLYNVSGNQGVGCGVYIRVQQ